MQSVPIRWSAPPTGSPMPSPPPRYSSSSRHSILLNPPLTISPKPPMAASASSTSSASPTSHSEAAGAPTSCKPSYSRGFRSSKLTRRFSSPIAFLGFAVHRPLAALGRPVLSNLLLARATQLPVLLNAALFFTPTCQSTTRVVARAAPAWSRAVHLRYLDLQRQASAGERHALALSVPPTFGFESIIRTAGRGDAAKTPSAAKPAVAAPAHSSR